MRSNSLSLENIIEYTRLEPEDSQFREMVIDLWPTESTISFIDYSASYREKGEMALKNITFHASYSEKIGVCGAKGIFPFVLATL